MNTTFTEPQHDSTAIASMTLRQTQRRLNRSLAGDKTLIRKPSLSPPSRLQFEIPAQLLASQESCRWYLNRFFLEANLGCQLRDGVVSEILAAAAEMSDREGGVTILMEVDVDVAKQGLTEETDRCDEIAVPVDVDGADVTFPRLAAATSPSAPPAASRDESDGSGVIPAATEDNGVWFKFRTQMAKKLRRLKKSVKDCFQGMKDCQEEFIEMALNMASESLWETI